VKADLAKLQKDEASLKQSGGQLLPLLKQKSEPLALDTVVSNMLVSVMQARLESRITVSAVNPGTNIATNGASPISALANRLESSDVQSARVNVRGTYEDYEGLLSYIEKVRKQSVAVVYLKIEGQQFELGLRAYGV
jgi:hypothetical protein